MNHGDIASVVQKEVISVPHKRLHRQERFHNKVNSLNDHYTINERFAPGASSNSCEHTQCDFNIRAILSSGTAGHHEKDAAR